MTEQFNITNRLCADVCKYSEISENAYTNGHNPAQTSETGNAAKVAVTKHRSRHIQPWTVFGEFAVADIGEGCVVVISSSDLPLVENRHWVPMVRGKNIYAQTGKGILMHRLLLGLERGDSRTGEHKDHFGLNNWRDNIRIASQADNRANSRKIESATSRFKGVRLQNGKWEACARKRINGEQVRLVLRGLTSEVAAALAYDAMALELFGDFAHTNFPLPSEAHRTAA